MKAMVYYRYGNADVFRLEDVEKPSPQPHEVLVKIYSASINSWDWDLVQGKPFITRLAINGLFRPKNKIIGSDFAGKVEAVGEHVHNIQVGDNVFGDISESGFGAFAEYAAVPPHLLTVKPEEMTFPQAAAIPQAGLMALNGIRQFGEINKGQSVLINGAGGGVGCFAVQIAKHLGAEVTGVDSGEKLEMIRSIGADHVIDYRKDDYTQAGIKYDYILDTVAYHHPRDYMEVLKNNGNFVMVGGSLFTVFKIMIQGKGILKRTGKHLILLMHQVQRDDLEILKDYFLRGIITPVIHNTYHLEELPEPLNEIKEGKVKGKAIINIKTQNNGT